MYLPNSYSDLRLSSSLIYPLIVPNVFFILLSYVSYTSCLFRNYHKIYWIYASDLSKDYTAIYQKGMQHTINKNQVVFTWKLSECAQCRCIAFQSISNYLRGILFILIVTDILFIQNSFSINFKSLIKGQSFHLIIKLPIKFIPSLDRFSTCSYS